MEINTDVAKIENILTRGVAEIFPAKKELAALMKKRKIRLYLGIDPTGTRLHLGHTVPLRKLQEFADLGHEAILVVGTGTVMAGDPSQREEARPVVSEKEIEANTKTWKKQAGKILDFSKVKIEYNGSWLLKLGLKEIIKIASNVSAIKLFQREMFQRRVKEGKTVFFHETLYPLLQGYDSVVLGVDLEIGGTDQIFNMLIGRELMQKMLNKEKFVLTTPLILGINGKPMSKTSGNCVWLDDSPDQMFGKIMSIPDEQIADYFEFLTRVPSNELEEIKSHLEKRTMSPRDAKVRLALEIVDFYHGAEMAREAKEEFERVFREKKPPTEIPEKKIKEEKINVLELLIKINLAPSKSEAKRLILQGGVKINGRIQDDWKDIVNVEKGMIVQVGKRKFTKII